MLDWIKHKLESRLPGKISITSDMQNDTTLMAESKEELKSLLMKVKNQESEKVALKLNFQKTKIMAPGPITSWAIDGETVSDFIFGAPKSLQMVTAAIKLKDACSFGRKAIINLDSILKSTDITLPTEVRLVKAIVFPVVMYGCESWTIEKAELLNCGVGEDS